MPTKDPVRRRLLATARVRRYRAKMSPEAKVRRRAIERRWLDANREHVRRRDRAHALRTTADRRRFIDAHKDRPCLDCGNEFPPCAMDFDHVRGVKYKNVALMKTNSYATIVAEIAKCDLVCSNCHRVRTANRGGMRGRPRKPPQ